MLTLQNKKFMFFCKLPISFDCLKEKLFLSDRIYVDKNAQEIITQIQEHHTATAYAVYPQYGIPGLGCQHRLFCADLDENESMHLRRQMWELLGILRLVKPLPIHVTGSIDVYDSQIQSIETNWHKTYLNLPQSFHNQVNDYSTVDISTSSQLFDSFYKASYNPNSRLRLATDSFIRTSFTEPIMFAQTFFQKLFPIVDLLSGNPSWNHDTHVKSNLGRWFQFVYGAEALQEGIDLEKVVESLWATYRNYYLHLSCSVAPPSHQYVKTDLGEFVCKSSNPQADNGEALLALHEVARLCLLSLLYLPEKYRLDFDSLPRVEMRLSRKERGNAEKERMVATQNYYQNLIDQKIKPNQKFWLKDIHCQIFRTLSGSAIE